MQQIKSLKILLYGESDRVGSGAWCYYNTLKDMGHSLIPFSEKKHLEKYYSKIIWKAIRKIKGDILEHHHHLHTNELIRTVSTNKPNVVIVLKGLLLDRVTIQKIKQTGAWVVIINHDDFFSFNKNNWSPIQRSALSVYDHIFVTREVNVDEIKRFNKSVEFFPFAYYPKIHKQIDIKPDEQSEWCSDVAFIGTWEKNRAQLLEQLVVKVPANYIIYGSQWHKVKKTSPLFKYLKFKEVSLDEMVKVIQTSKISLGFLRKENRDEYTQRTFEIPACGGFLLAERTKIHKYFYKEGTEAEFFDPNNSNELIEKVRFLLENTEKREAIRIAGISALKKQKHTYQDRLERLLEIYYNL